MRVVFVDDEQRVLDGLEMMMFEQEDEWEILFFDNGSEALTYMDANDVDVIVSDMRMPGMTGEQLLREVAERHPEVVRIVLSGQVEAEVAERTLVMVHDFLPKPCSADELIDTVTRAIALAWTGRSERMRKVVGAATRLPARPNMYLQIRETMSNPDYALDDLADILTTDIAMSTTVLHLANSAYFARGARAEDVREAVRRLGAEVVAGVALTAESFGAFDLKNADIDRLNDHALQTVAAVRAILNKPRSIEIEAAALHPVGHLVISSLLPAEYRQAFRHAEQEGCSLSEALEATIGFTDAHAGAYLLRLWKIDERVASAIESMDTPWDTIGEARRAAATIWALHTLSGFRSRAHAPDPLPDDIAALAEAAIRHRDEVA